MVQRPGPQEKDNKHDLNKSDEDARIDVRSDKDG